MISSVLNIAANAFLNDRGVVGSVAIIGTNPVAAPDGYVISKIVFLGATVVASATSTQTTAANLASFTSGFAANAEVLGRWSTITLTSGYAIGYLTKA